MTRALDLALLNRLGPSDPIQALRENTQELTPAQLSNIGGGFVTGAGMADFLGQYPAFPDAEISTAEMLRGQRELSAAENFGEGNYVTAGLQGLGAIGDLAAMVPIVGPAVSKGLKAPRALQKYMKMTGESNEIIARQNLRELMEVDPRTGKNEFGLSDTTKAQLEARGFDARDIGELNNILRPTQDQEQRARALGFDMKIHHGTMKDLDVFDPELLDPNAYGGKGVYGSTTFDDSYHNYANLYGPDNQAKVEKRAREIEFESGYKIDYDSARNMAEKELNQTSNVYNLWARTNKHAIIGDPENSTFIKGSDEWQAERERLRQRFDEDLSEDEIDRLNDELFAHEYNDYDSPFVMLRGALEANGMNPEGVERFMESMENYDKFTGGLTTHNVNEIIDDLTEYIDIDFYPETYHPTGEFKRSVFEDLGFEGIVDKNPKKRFYTMDYLEDDTVHVITFPKFRENVRSAEANFDPDKQFEPELYLQSGGEVTDDKERMITMARLANIGGMFAPGSGIADASAGYPEFPSVDASVLDMLQGERSKTLAENIEQGGLGGYGMAALQGLGVAGDALYAIPFIGPAAGATVGTVLKTPLAVTKVLKLLKAKTPEEAIAKLDKLGLEETVKLENAVSADSNIGKVILDDTTSPSANNLYRMLHSEVKTSLPIGTRALDLLATYGAETLEGALETAVEARKIKQGSALDDIDADILDLQSAIKFRGGDTTSARAPKFLEDDTFEVIGQARTVKMPDYLRRSYTLAQQGKISQSPEEILQFGSELTDLKSILQEAISNPDRINIDSFISNPAVVKGIEKLNEIPLTSQHPDYLSENWFDSRIFQLPNGQPVAQGYVDGIQHLYETSKRLAWDDDGLEYLPSLRPAGEAKKAIIVIGQPASGKSTIANPIARKYNATIIDGDEAKKLLPEYENGIGANAVHQEAKVITKSVKNLAVAQGDNIVTPTIGHDPSRIRKEIEFYKSKGYEVDIVDVAVSPKNATTRMLMRYANTGRIIPIDYIQMVGTKPSQTYDILKSEGVADGFTRIDNNVGFKDRKPVIEDQRGIIEDTGL